MVWTATGPSLRPIRSDRDSSLVEPGTKTKKGPAAARLRGADGPLGTAAGDLALQLHEHYRTLRPRSDLQANRNAAGAHTGAARAGECAC
jgi:hypothetical protein